MMSNPVRVEVPKHTATERYVVLGIAPGRGLLVSRDDLSDAEPGALLGRPHLGFDKGDGFTELPYDDENSNGKQITAASMSGDRVVWVETSSTDLFNFDWSIYTAELGQGGRQLLGTSETYTAGRPPRPVYGGTVPIIAANRAYWAATKRGGEDGGVSDIWASAPLEARHPGSPEIVVPGGRQPASDGENLYYTRLADNKSTSIMKRSATGKETEVVSVPASDGEVRKLAASDSILTWVESDGQSTSRLLVKDLATGQVSVNQLKHAGSTTMVLFASGSFVVWGNGSAAGDSGIYLLDQAKGAIEKLADSPGYSVIYLQNRALAWTQPSQDSGETEYEWVTASLN